MKLLLISIFSFILATGIVLAAAETLQPVRPNLRFANQQLRKEKHEPLQWLKKNGRSEGVMSGAERACFEKQRAEFESAMKNKEAQKLLKKANVKRMTYNLYSNSRVSGGHFVWDMPQRYDAYGGNYFIVKFGVANGQCHFTSAKDLLEGPVAALKNKVKESDKAELERKIADMTKNVKRPYRAPSSDEESDSEESVAESAPKVEPRPVSAPEPQDSASEAIELNGE